MPVKVAKDMVEEAKDRAESHMAKEASRSARGISARARIPKGRQEHSTATATTVASMATELQIALIPSQTGMSE